MNVWLSYCCFRSVCFKGADSITPLKGAKKNPKKNPKNSRTPKRTPKEAKQKNPLGNPTESAISFDPRPTQPAGTDFPKRRPRVPACHPPTKDRPAEPLFEKGHPLEALVGRKKQSKVTSVITQEEHLCVVCFDCLESARKDHVFGGVDERQGFLSNNQ